MEARKCTEKLLILAIFDNFVQFRLVESLVTSEISTKIFVRKLQFLVLETLQSVLNVFIFDCCPI